MIELTLEHFERLERALKDTPRKIPKAASRAINRAAETARTEAARKAREEYHIKHGDVIKTVTIQKASEGNLSATVTSRGPTVPLIRFKVTPKKPEPRRKKPLRAAVKKSGGGIIKGAFTAGMQSGHIGVYSRTTDKRFPIKQHYGPSVPQMLGSDTVSAWVEEKSQERLDDRLEHEISRALED